MRLLSKKVVIALRRFSRARLAASLIPAPSFPPLIAAPKPLLIAAPIIAIPSFSPNEGSAVDHFKNPNPLADSSVNKPTAYPLLANSTTPGNIDSLADDLHELSLISKGPREANANVVMHSEPSAASFTRDSFVGGVTFSHVPCVDPCAATHHSDGGYTLIPISDEAKKSPLPSKKACLFNLRHVAQLHGFQLCELQPNLFTFSSTPPAGESPTTSASPPEEEMPLIGPSPEQHALLKSIHLDSDVDMGDPVATALSKEISLLHQTLVQSLHTAVASGMLDPDTGTFKASTPKDKSEDKTL